MPESDWKHDKLHDITKEYVNRSNLKLKDVIHPLRLMITGKSVGAGMFETMAVIGKAECIERFEEFLSKEQV